MLKFDVEKRRNFEKKLIRTMIEDYYGDIIREKRKKLNKNELISFDKDIKRRYQEERDLLIEYASKRTMFCRQMRVKTFCHMCETPCYSKDMIEKITEVMRRQGKSMIYKHPVMCIRQICYVIRGKLAKNNA